MNIKSLCQELVDLSIKEFKEEKHFDKLKDNVLNPCINYMVNQFYPYIITTVIIFILTFLLAIGIFMLLLKGK
jgi:hypothetical protein